MNSYWLSTSVLVQHITCVIQNCRDCLQVAWAKETVCENSEKFGYGKANPWLPTRLGNMSRRKLRESKILLRGAMLGGAWSQCLVEPELVELTGLFLVGRLHRGACSVELERRSRFRNIGQWLRHGIYMTDHKMKIFTGRLSRVCTINWWRRCQWIGSICSFWLIRFSYLTLIKPSGLDASSSTSSFKGCCAALLRTKILYWGFETPCLERCYAGRVWCSYRSTNLDLGPLSFSC